MRERPILFSAPMVRAILEGRKTQTRRVVKHPRGGEFDVENGRPVAECTDGETRLIDCPYGQPGDRLWVRETFSGPQCMEASEGAAAVPPSKWGRSSRLWYWADGNPADGDWTRARPSIHMPRWASRITLEVTGVRVERLQSISDDDAIAEGLDRHAQSLLWKRGPLSTDQNIVDWTGFPLLAFRSIWEAINGAESWAANPWVWVVEFRRITPPEAPGHGE